MMFLLVHILSRGITAQSMGSGCCRILGQCFQDATCTSTKPSRYSLETDVRLFH